MPVLCSNAIDYNVVNEVSAVQGLWYLIFKPENV